MTSGYVYGNYLNFQINLDPGKTKSRYQAKWRSQIPVRLDLGFHLTVGEDEYWRIENTTEAGESNFSVNVVHIDDLDFQIKSTREVDDFFWIYKAPVAIIGGRAPIGQDLSIRDTYVPVERNLNVANPNSDRFTAPVLVAKPVITPTFIDFAPQRLELGYDYGAVGGPEFKTDTIETANGTQQRNALHYLPLGRWQLGDRLVAESNADLLTEVSYLKSFHEARRGSYQGFRYKDWADYYARNQFIATGDGVKTEFQLKKAYRAGDAVTYRPIQKPVFGTVDLFVDGINVAVDLDHEWEVNHDTGVISHPQPLPEGAVLSANFEFDVPVWFESDEIGFSLQAYEPESGDSIYRLESVFVVEGRIPLTLPWQMENIQEITEPLELGIIYDTIEKHSYSTDKLVLANNFARREVKRKDTKNVFDIGDRIFDREELDRLLGYFYTCRGQSIQFPLTDKQKKYLANWSSDRLVIKFSALNNSDTLFSLSGLKLDLVPAPEPEFQLDYTDLYGHFTYLETSPNTNIYNYHNHGVNVMERGGNNDVVAINPDSSNIYKSATYITESRGSRDINYYRVRNIPVDSDVENGFSLIMNGKLGNEFFGSYLVKNTPGGSPSLNLYYRRSNKTWNRDLESFQTFDPDAYNSYALVLEYSTGITRIYANGILDAQNQPTAPISFKGSFRADFGRIVGGSIGSIQIWKKALLREDILALHPNGIRKPLRSATPKDTGVGHPIIITPEDDGFGYTGDSSGGLAAFTPAQTESLPLINKGYLKFSGQKNSLSFPAIAIGVLKQIYFVFNSTANISQNSEFQSLIFFTCVHTNGKKVSFFKIHNDLYVDLVNGTQLRQIRYTTPSDLFDGTNKECVVDVERALLIVNGVTVFSKSSTNYSNASHYNSVTSSYIGFRGSGGQSNIAPFDVALLIPMNFENDMNATYTLGSDFIYRIARIFYQMGFKKSLAYLEPDNPRLLAGDYPI